MMFPPYNQVSNFWLIFAQFAAACLYLEIAGRDKLVG
jgi:hypothetical protein